VQEEAAVPAREEEERRRHEAHLSISKSTTTQKAWKACLYAGRRLLLREGAGCSVLSVVLLHPLALCLVCVQEEAAVTAREEEERRRHEAHLKKLQNKLEAKKEAERRWAVVVRAC
jgi:hypothetical protein